MGNPVSLCQAKQFSRLGISKNDLTGSFKENQDRQAIENSPLCIGVRILMKIQARYLRRN
jgi:hypothetical protein